MLLGKITSSTSDGQLITVSWWPPSGETIGLPSIEAPKWVVDTIEEALRRPRHVGAFDREFGDLLAPDISSWFFVRDAVVGALLSEPGLFSTPVVISPYESDLFHGQWRGDVVVPAS